LSYSLVGCYPCWSSIGCFPFFEDLFHDGFCCDVCDWYSFCLFRKSVYYCQTVFVAVGYWNLTKSVWICSNLLVGLMNFLNGVALCLVHSYNMMQIFNMLCKKSHHYFCRFLKFLIQQIVSQKVNNVELKNRVYQYFTLF